MKILVCAAEAPLPPLNGFRLQILPVCEELAKRHEVTVLAYRWPDQYGDPPADFELQTLELPRRGMLRRTFDSLRTTEPLAVVSHGPMAAAAARLIADRDFDVLHIDGWNLAGLTAELPGIPTVLTALDAVFLNYEAKSEVAGPFLRPLYRREARRVRRFESENYPNFDSVVLVSDEDVAALRALNPAMNAVALPNGVDSEFFKPDPGAERDPDLVVFTGAMQWAPNARTAMFLAREVLPHLRERHPGAKLALVGRQPGPEVTALGRIENVEVTGEVPDIREWLQRGAVFSCPMVSGTGIKNKLLEAMAMELACVASPLAAQGMKVTDGRELVLAESAEQHGEQIAALLDDPDQARQIGRRGREYMIESHSWAAVGQAYERLLQDALARPGARAPAPGPGEEAATARISE